jgi:hypothetical protein
LKQRGLLQKQLVTAWKHVIEQDYLSQRINSERSLQAALWARLNQELPATRRLFIEPAIQLGDDQSKKTMIPDIVVCNTREVIGILELKYMPRTSPRVEKDIKNLATIAKERAYLSIANDRFRGKDKDVKTYPLSRNVLFAWAGIHSREIQPGSPLYSAGYPELDGCFLELHAITSQGEDPHVFYRS